MTKAEENIHRQKLDHEIEMQKQNEEASNLKLSNIQLSAKMKNLSEQTKADKTLLRTEIEILRNEVDRLKGDLSDQSCNLALSTKKDQDVIDKQILGDFAYQLQKLLAGVIKSKKKSVTPGQIAYEIKYEALSEEQKMNIDTAKLSDKKVLKKLEVDVDTIKELRYSTAHYALSNNISMSLDEIEALATKHQVLDSIRNLITHWKNLSAGKDNDNVFKKELILSSKYK